MIFIVTALVVSSVATVILLCDLRFWGRVEEHDDNRGIN